MFAALFCPRLVSRKCYLLPRSISPIKAHSPTILVFHVERAAAQRPPHRPRAARNVSRETLLQKGAGIDVSRETLLKRGVGIDVSRETNANDLEKPPQKAPAKQAGAG